MKYFEKRWECMKAHKIFWLNLAAIIIISIVVSGGMFFGNEVRTNSFERWS